MPIDDFVKELVHDALYVAACGYGAKAQMAEAELRDRGDIISADTAATLRGVRTRAVQVLHDPPLERINVKFVRWLEDDDADR